MNATDTKRARAMALRTEGWTYPDIARHFRVSPSTARRWCDPTYEDYCLRQSREAKRRRTGVCVDCGATTRYNGHDSGVSERCHPCGAIESGKRKTVWTKEALITAIRMWADEHEGEPPGMVDWNATAAYAMGDVWRALRFENDQRWPWFMNVVRIFGSWNNGIRAAGFEPRANHGGAGNQRRRRDVAA